jgi:hypothetical protein
VAILPGREVTAMAGEDREKGQRTSRKDEGMSPPKAAEAVEPRTARKAGEDPREETGVDQPQSSAQKNPEPPER